ncbi:MAG: cell division protein ZapA [Rhodospirillaceae bacterium]|nr:cell division protein ZapA [Rhodospirillaceae bacterium]
MPRIDITLNGRVYPIACEPGQEDRVIEIARYLDAKLTEIRGSVQTASDTHLLVMVSLLVVDELFDAREETAAFGEAAAADPGNGAIAAEAIGRLAQRVEALAARLDRA